MEQSVIFAVGNEIQPDEIDLSSQTSGKAEGSLTLADVERRHIFEVLKNCDGNKSEAALALGVARSTLVLKLKGYPSTDPDASVSE
jgi:DNA-binding NtrC family response regulator